MQTFHSYVLVENMHTHTRVCMCAHKLTHTQYFLMLHEYLVFILMYWGYLGCTETFFTERHIMLKS